MLAKASLAAPGYCLRCRLRQVIFRTPQTSPVRRLEAVPKWSTRGFRTTTPRCQDREGGRESTFLKRSKNDDRKKERYRREWPLGRIVGKEGRKQREHSQTLSIKAMKEPFDVVLMQDVPNAGRASEAPLTEMIEQTIFNEPEKIALRDGKPSQDEVNTSLDELRPDTHIVNQETYDNLSEKLVNGYSAQQLSSYLKNHFALPSKRQKGRSEVSHQPQWQPGQTPLHVRHRQADAAKSDPGRNLTKLADEVLGVAWNLSVQADEQQLGELELPLKPWQIRYLFDLRWEGKPNYERDIQSSLLLRSSRIEPYRDDNVVRITARRLDAEEIAALLTKALRSVHTDQFDLNVFKPLLGEPGWPSRLGNLFSDSEMEFVGQRTTSVIEKGAGGMLSIHERTEFLTYMGRAKRFLLSLLRLPSPTSTRRLVIKSDQVGAKDSRSHDVLESNIANLHLRHRNTKLYRAALPISRGIKDSDLKAQDIQHSLTERIVEHLDKFELPSHLRDQGQQESTTNSSYWKPVVDSDLQSWEVQLCRILVPSITSAAVEKRRASRSDVQPRHDRTVIQTQLPGVDTLLSFFSPKAAEFAFDDAPREPPSLIAHFFPVPHADGGLAAMRKLPRIELCFRVEQQSGPGDSSAAPLLRISRLSATLSEQDLRVSLHGETADLRFVRRVTLTSRLDRVEKDQHIGRFTEALRQSMASGNGAMRGEPAVQIKLPAWVVKDDGADGDTKATKRNDVAVEYMFERFEWVQSADFHPLRGSDLPQSSDVAMKEDLESMPEAMSLQCRAREGGIVAGSGMELVLKNDLGGKETVESATTRLVDSSLRLVQCLTRMNAGRVAPHRFGT